MLLMDHPFSFHHKLRGFVCIYIKERGFVQEESCSDGVEPAGVGHEGVMSGGGFCPRGFVRGWLYPGFNKKPLAKYTNIM